MSQPQTEATEERMDFQLGTSVAGHNTDKMMDTVLEEGKSSVCSDQELIHKRVTESFVLLCKYGLNFDEKLRVEGVLTVTMDDRAEFNVHINDTFNSDGTKVLQGNASSNKSASDTENILHNGDDSEDRDIIPIEIIPIEDYDAKHLHCTFTGMSSSEQSQMTEHDDLVYPTASTRPLTEELPPVIVLDNTIDQENSETRSDVSSVDDQLLTNNESYSNGLDEVANNILKAYDNIANVYDGSGENAVKHYIANNLVNTTGSECMTAPVNKHSDFLINIEPTLPATSNWSANPTTVKQLQNPHSVCSTSNYNWSANPTIAKCRLNPISRKRDTMAGNIVNSIMKHTLNPLPHKSTKNKKQLVVEHTVVSHVHNTSKRSQCIACERWFNSLEVFKHHMWMHDADAECTCHICYKKVLQDHKYITHMKTHAAFEDSQCKKCYRVFSNSNECQRHMRSYQCHYKPVVNRGKRPKQVMSQMVSDAVRSLADPQGCTIHNVHRFIRQNYLLRRYTNLYPSLLQCLRDQVEQGDLIAIKHQGDPQEHYKLNPARQYNFTYADNKSSSSSKALPRSQRKRNSKSMTAAERKLLKRYKIRECYVRLGRIDANLKHNVRLNKCFVRLERTS